MKVLPCSWAQLAFSTFLVHGVKDGEGLHLQHQLLVEAELLLVNLLLQLERVRLESPDDDLELLEPPTDKFAALHIPQDISWQNLL